MNVERQTIRIFLDAGNGVISVGLVNTHSTGGPNAMGVEKDHNLANHFLRRPCLNHPLFAFRTNAIEFRQPFWGLFNDVKDDVPKRLDQFLRKVWSNPFDHPRTKVFLHAFQGTGRDDAEVLGLKLQAMGAVGEPCAFPFNILSRSNRRRCPNDGHEVPMTTNFDTEDTETRLFTVEGHTLDGTREMFRRRGSGGSLCRRFHGMDSTGV